MCKKKSSRYLILDFFSIESVTVSLYIINNKRNEELFMDVIIAIYSGNHFRSHSFDSNERKKKKKN